MQQAIMVLLLTCFSLSVPHASLGQQLGGVGSTAFGTPVEAYEVRPGYIVTVARDERGRPRQYVVEKGSVAGHPVAAERFSERVVEELIEQLTPRSVRGEMVEA